MNEVLGYTRHPASAVWPDQGDEEFEALKLSIRELGQADPIEVTPDNQVFDGWQRLAAIEDLQQEGMAIDPVVVVRGYSDSEIAKRVIGKHKGRRHMSKLDMAIYVVNTLRSCGGEFPQPGRPHPPTEPESVISDQTDPIPPAEDGENESEKPGKNCQVSDPAPVIDRRTVADQSGVSERTAGEAIAEARRREAEPDPEAEAERIKRKAEAAAKRAAKPKPLQEQLSFWKESNEVLSAELAEARARLAEVAADLDDEVSDEDANAEFKRAMAELRKANDRLHTENNQLRERAEEAESQVVHFKTYASEIEAALQNRGG